jgi:hypothetical protein
VSQSSTIAFFLMAGFLVFITMRGELPAYAAVMGIGPKTQSSLDNYNPLAITNPMGLGH